jgi:hypothetical protein
MKTDSLILAVIMQRTPLDNRWQPHQWKPTEISPDALLHGTTARCLRSDETNTR